MNQYCVGSGAQLNRAKCNILTLDIGGAPTTLTGMGSLERHEQVKFLGVKFGQGDTTPTMLARTDRSVLDRL